MGGINIWQDFYSLAPGFPTSEDLHSLLLPIYLSIQDCAIYHTEGDGHVGG